MQSVSPHARSVSPRSGPFDFLVADLQAAGKAMIDGARTVMWMGGDSPSGTSYRQVKAAATEGEGEKDTGTSTRWHLSKSVATTSITPSRSTAPRSVPSSASSSSSSSASVSSSSAHRFSTPSQPVSTLSPFRGVGSDSKSPVRTDPMASGSRPLMRTPHPAVDAAGSPADPRETARQSLLAMQPTLDVTEPQGKALTALTQSLAARGNEPDLNNSGDSIFRTRDGKDQVVAIRNGLYDTDGQRIDNLLHEVVTTVQHQDAARPRRFGGLLAPKPLTEAQRREALTNALHDRLLSTSKSTAGEGLGLLLSDRGKNFLTEVGRRAAAWETLTPTTGAKGGNARHAIKNALLFFGLSSRAVELGAAAPTAATRALYNELSRLTGQLASPPRGPDGQPKLSTPPTYMQRMQVSVSEFVDSLVPRSVAS